ELSEVVATPFGYHIIRVEEKETPAFDDYAEEMRQRMQIELVLKAESLYVTGIEQRANVEVQEGAAEIVREIARNPAARLSGRAARRALVRFEGGEVTVDEVRTFLQPR